MVISNSIVIRRNLTVEIYCIPVKGKGSVKSFQSLLTRISSGIVFVQTEVPKGGFNSRLAEQIYQNAQDKNSMQGKVVDEEIEKLTNYIECFEES